MQGMLQSDYPVSTPSGDSLKDPVVVNLGFVCSKIDDYELFESRA